MWLADTCWFKKKFKAMLEMLMCLELACALSSVNPPPPAAGEEAPAESAPHNIKNTEEG